MGKGGPKTFLSPGRKLLNSNPEIQKLPEGNYLIPSKPRSRQRLKHLPDEPFLPISVQNMGKSMHFVSLSHKKIHRLSH